jgi:very-short-patch-repair endonuclease
MFPEASAKLLVKTAGAFWLWRHGAKREVRIRLWKGSEGWYAADLCIPHKKLIVEADGGIHYKTKQRDYIRDFRLQEKNWKVLRVTDREMKNAPYLMRRRIRKFLRG